MMYIPNTTLITNDRHMREVESMPTKPSLVLNGLIMNDKDSISLKYFLLLFAIQ